MTWREYHEATKHTDQSLRRAQYALDWANMPDPFRHYEGVPVLDLPADPPAPEIPALDLVRGVSGTTTAADGASFLSELLLYSAAISATKRVPTTGYQYALRVNPSSGNLHPTEFHFITRGLKQWPDGLYHYRPSSHMAEQRAAGSFDLELRGSSAPLVFVLTSISWREAWKYRDRAYRYCLLDIGHAWQSLKLSARAMGCGTIANGDFADDEVAQFCHLNEDEWPMLVMGVAGSTIPIREPGRGKAIWFEGVANRLSTHATVYPLIEGIHAATKLREQAGAESVRGTPNGSGSIPLPPPIACERPFGEVTRKRRSALDFLGGNVNISQEQLAALLIGATHASFGASRFVQLYLYVHRVEGLKPGIYRYWRRPSALELIRAGDQRVAAAGLSLGQDLAGNACVAFSMIADLERATARYGDRAYRYVHFEAGAVGQCLYLSAEALGLGATGIGAFFDDKVHDYLNITPHQGQVIYHFAIGYPIPDPRLSAADDLVTKSI
jgi:SagB-type dehydrogenase family enzyme